MLRTATATQYANHTIDLVEINPLLALSKACVMVK